MTKLSDTLDKLNAEDTRTGVTRREKILKRVVSPLAAVALLAAAAGVVDRNITDPKSHSVYEQELNDAPKMPIVVEPNATPNSIVNQVTGGLSGELRDEELKYVQDQGLAVGPDGGPVLEAGQLVQVPEVQGK